MGQQEGQQVVSGRGAQIKKNEGSAFGMQQYEMGASEQSGRYVSREGAWAGVETSRLHARAARWPAGRVESRDRSAVGSSGTTRMCR